MQCLPPLSSATLPSPTALLRDSNAGHQADLATLAEVFADTVADGAVTGFVLAHLQGAVAPVLWVQDRVSLREAGRPALAGLTVPLRLVHVTVSRPADVLWTMEEGLRCSGLAAVVGEVWGDPPVLDFTASKRLALRAEAQALPAFLIRRAASANLSAARLRWRVASLPSAPDPDDLRAPGKPLWRAELFRARFRPPGAWVASHEDAGLQLSHAVQADQANPARATATAG